MRMLLFGANGQVGWELQRALAPLGEVIALDRGGLDGLCGDLAHPEALADTIREVGPEVIVNAAAYTAVDKAESEESLAQTVNAAAPAAMAGAAKRDALLVHYSTDFVFDGSSDQPWKETDRTGPLNAYFRTKLEGEVAIQQSGCNHLVSRTSWVYASRRHNFIRTMLRLSAGRESSQVIDDQYGAPTGAQLIADMTAQVIPKVLASRERGGFYHLAAAGEPHWHNYACFVIERAREAGWPVKVARSDRKSSQTFGRWVGEILSAENKRQLWVPEGFAHGFVVMSGTAESLYKTTGYYASDHERCIRWDDPVLAIQWPVGTHPILSAKDSQGEMFLETEAFA